MFERFSRHLQKYKALYYLSGSLVIIPYYLYSEVVPSHTEVQLSEKLMKMSNDLPSSLTNRPEVIQEIESLARTTLAVVYDPTKAGKTQTMLDLRQSAADRRFTLMLDCRELLKLIQSEIVDAGSYESIPLAEHFILMAAFAAMTNQKEPLIILDQAEAFEPVKLKELTKFLARAKRKGASVVLTTNDLALYYKLKSAISKVSLHELPPFTRHEFETTCENIPSSLTKAELNRVAQTVYHAVGPDFGIVEEYLSLVASSSAISVEAFLANLEQQYYTKLKTLAEKGLKRDLANCLGSVNKIYPLGCSFLGFEFGASLVAEKLGRERGEGTVTLANSLVFHSAKRVLAELS
mmetsp:Transcript_34777/g.61209  ORF Transcript_34777/g.61209 Transcript_34777/m.61209 type:complete len:350 (+) Transcript_34777:1865-2914(+)